VKSRSDDAEEDLHELKTVLLQKNEETRAHTQRIEEVSSKLAQMREEVGRSAIAIESLN
jgi:hypothetical protein